MVWNESAPSLAVVVEYRHTWDAAWTTFTNYLSLQTTRVWDKGDTLRMRVMNPGGKHTHTFSIGDRIRVRLGRGTAYAHPVFDGYVPPGAGRGRAGLAEQPEFELAAVGFLGRLTRESFRIGPYRDSTGTIQVTTFAGWEVGMAIREVIAGLAGTPLDTAGILGTDSPKTFIDDAAEAPEKIHKKRALVEHYRKLAYNDQVDSDNPRPYHLVEAPIANGDPGIRFIKEPDPETGTAVKTLNYASDVFRIDSESQLDQATKVTAQSIEDPSIFETYQDDDAATRFGTLEATVDVPTTDRGILLRRAWNEVQKRRLPQLSHRIKILDAWWAVPGLTVDVVSSKYGAEGKQLITRVDHKVGTDAVWSVLHTRTEPREAS